MNQKNNRRSAKKATRSRMLRAFGVLSFGVGVACNSSVDDAPEAVGSDTEQAQQESSAFRGSHSKDKNKNQENISITLRIPAGTSLEDYAIIAGSRISFGERSTVRAGVYAPGNVVSFGPIDMDEDTLIRGNVYSSGGITIGDDSQIQDELIYSGSITKGNDITIGKENKSDFDVEEMTLTLTVADEPNTDISIEGTDNVDVGPGSYDSFVAPTDSRVSFAPGVYTFDTFEMQSGSRLSMDAKDGPVQVIVKDKLTLEGRVFVNGPAGEMDPGMLVYLGSDTVQLTEARSFIGTLVAPNATIDVSGDGIAASLIADQVVIQNRTLLQGNPFPWTLGHFNDGDESTPDQTVVESVDVGGCPPHFDVEVDPSLDEDGNGQPDVIALIPREAPEGCEPARFCKEVIAGDGTVTYEELPPTPVYSEEFPVPVDAVKQGCSAEEAAASCRNFSDGTPGEGCDALEADPDCLTVTLCPDPGTTDNPSDSGAVREFSAEDFRDLRAFLPAGVKEVAPGEVTPIPTDDNSLYINPCEWDEVVGSYEMGFDVEGQKKGGGAYCTSDDECNSGVCGGEDVDGLFFYRTCTDAKSKVFFELYEGNDNFNVRLAAGMPEGRSRVSRAAFYPSAQFEVTSNTIAHASATIFGEQLTLFDAAIESTVTECGYRLDWHAEAFQQEYEVIDGKLGETLEPYTVGGFSDGDANNVNDASSDGDTAQCKAALQELWAAEKDVNEKLHDALIASEFYKSAGTTGVTITSRQVAQDYIDTYEQAAATYQEKVEEFRDIQERVLDHGQAALVAKHEIGLDVGYRYTYPIGWVNIDLELGAFGRAGVNDMAVENSADMRFDSTDEKPCDDVECMRVRAEATVTPWTKVGAFAVAAVSAGYDGWAGVRVGVRGDLSLLDFEMPITSQFLLDRGIVDQAKAIASAGAAMPEQLASVIGTEPSALSEDAYHVTPSLARYHAPFSIGSGLGTADGVNVRASFLDGSLKVFAKVWALFLSKKWEKTIVTWNGIERDWQVSEGGTGNALSGRVGVSVPNMVLLPKITLVDTPGEDLDGSAAGHVSADLATTQLPGRRPYNNSHHETGLGFPWDSEGERCREQVSLR